jgi:hypothetical protein
MWPKSAQPDEARVHGRPTHGVIEPGCISLDSRPAHMHRKAQRGAGSSRERPAEDRPETGVRERFGLCQVDAVASGQAKRLSKRRAKGGIRPLR